MKLTGYDSDSTNYEAITFISETELRRQKAYKKAKGICQLCLTECDYKDATIDHIKPKAKGGTNNYKNIQLAHKWCNLIKGDSEEIRSPEYYKEHSLFKRLDH